MICLGSPLVSTYFRYDVCTRVSLFAFCITIMQRPFFDDNKPDSQTRHEGLCGSRYLAIGKPKAQTELSTAA